MGGCVTWRAVTVISDRDAAELLGTALRAVVEERRATRLPLIRSAVPALWQGRRLNGEHHSPVG